MRRTTTLIFLILLASHFREDMATDTDYVETVMVDCTDEIVDLALCLREDRSIFTKIQLCEKRLSKLFLCMANYTEELRGELRADSMEDDDELVMKRGLGRCIQRCLQGPGNMSFIQCKSMCHK